MILRVYSTIIMLKTKMANVPASKSFLTYKHIHTCMYAYICIHIYASIVQRLCSSYWAWVGGYRTLNHISSKHHSSNKVKENTITYYKNLCVSTGYVMILVFCQFINTSQAGKRGQLTYRSNLCCHIWINDYGASHWRQ